MTTTAGSSIWLASFSVMSSVCLLLALKNELENELKNELGLCYQPEQLTFSRL